MFERFQDRARRVVVIAQFEASSLNCDMIGTEHILLGLITEGEGVAAKVLKSMGIELQAVQGKIEEKYGRAENAPTRHTPFSPRAKKVFELSLRESYRLNHNYIGVEHILLALIREGEGRGVEVLREMGVDLNAVREQVLALRPESRREQRNIPKPGEHLRKRVDD